MFGNLGFGEIMMILVVLLLVFGARRLPEIGSSFGKGIREFKRSLSDTQDAIAGRPSQEEQSNESRKLDSPAAPPSGGEPKRLSQ